jgi:adenosylhomocysteine nucleosidase
MKIGIIGAMIEEVSLLREDIKNPAIRCIGSREYYSGNLHGIETILAFSRCGKVASAVTAATMILTYHVDCIIFTGLAGAIDPKLNIGDIVIANKLYQHDMDASPLFKKFEIPLTNTIFFETNAKLTAQIAQVAQSFCKYEIKNILTPEIVQEFSLDKPKCYQGLITSGDQFVASEEQKIRIKQAMPHTLAVEMEGAAIAQVCYEHNIPFSVLRIISDSADHSASVNFFKFINTAAKYYTKNLIKNTFEKIADMDFNPALTLQPHS